MILCVRHSLFTLVTFFTIVVLLSPWRVLCGNCLPCVYKPKQAPDKTVPGKIPESKERKPRRSASQKNTSNKSPSAPATPLFRSLSFPDTKRPTKVQKPKYIRIRRIARTKSSPSRLESVRDERKSAPPQPPQTPRARNRNPSIPCKLTQKLSTMEEGEENNSLITQESTILRSEA